MAGSINRYQYTTDDGDFYAIKCDKSNTEAINLSDAVQASAELVLLPPNIQPRFVIYRSDNGKITRKVYVMTPNQAPADLLATYTVPQPQAGTTTINVVLKKSFFSGEKQSFVPTTDTALKDNESTTTA